MTVVYHELLPESYLLVLAPGPVGQPETSLAYWLLRAQRSGKAAVWVDCTMLTALTSEAARLLWALHHRLLKRHSQLVLVHVPDRVRQALLDQEPGPALCMVPTLLDAAAQTHWQTRHAAGGGHPGG